MTDSIARPWMELQVGGFRDVLKTLCYLGKITNTLYICHFILFTLISLNQMITKILFIFRQKGYCQETKFGEFNLLNQVLRSKIFLHRDEKLRAVHVILGFKPISNHFQVSKHMIKARDSRLALVDVAVKGFIWKPPPVGTKFVDLPTFKDPQPTVEEIVSSNEEVETQSKEAEESTLGESTKSLVHDKDFEVFYRPNEIEEVASSSRLATSLVSGNQEATEVHEAMVLEKRLPNLLSLLESHAETTTSEVLVVPRPPTPIPPPSPQTKPVDKKRKRDKMRKGLYRGRGDPRRESSRPN